MQPVIEKIRDELGKEIQGFRDLLQVVEEERQILLSGKHERLLATSERKMGLSSSLAEMQKERRRLMSQLGSKDGEPLRLADLSAFLEPTERSRFKAVVSQLTGMAGELNTKNSMNKQFIEDALDTVEHVMGLLMAGAPNPVYGAAGARRGVSRPRILAREV